MRLNLFKAAILTLCFMLLYISGYAQSASNAENKKDEGANTTIVINFKKNTDRRYTTLKKINPLYFEPALVSPPTHKIDTSDRLKTIIKLNLSEPSYLALGFGLFYIEPGDSVLMNYETLLVTKTEFKDTITINHGNIFFITRNAGISPSIRGFLNDFYKGLENITAPNQMMEYLSATHINNIIGNYTKLVYKDYPNLNSAYKTFQKVNNINLNNFYRSLLFRLQYVYKNKKDELLKNAIQQSVQKMLDNACRQKEIMDPITLGKYSGMYIFFKELNLSGDTIRRKFDTCNDTVKQYILINLLNDGFLPDSNINNRALFISKLTYPPFKEFALKFQNTNKGLEKSGYVNNAIRDITIFDANDNKIYFEDLFKTTKQPYFIVDFCGTWCKPCLDEMAVYKQTKNLENSKKIRPIWLFFENDKTKWLDVVKQYNLNPENCFVIIGNQSQALTKEFALLLDWQGEFPHHFVLAKDGKIIQKNAVSLSAFSESNLTPVTKNERGNLSAPPPPPPGIK